MSEPNVYLNGRMVPASQAHLAIYDAGIVLGATVTEQTRTFHKRLWRLNDHLDRTGARRYTIAAASDETGELAAFSVLSVDPDHPDWGFQGDTGVLRHHRGHRLGMLVKAAMLEWLATAEPGLRRIETGNAATNKYMIAINEQLGFTLHGRTQAFDLPVAALLGD